MVRATVVQFRRGRKTFTPRHFLLRVDGVSTREAASSLVGSSVSWSSTGKEPKVIAGKISSAHGNNGVVRAIFERGLPGQAIGTDVEIVGTVQNETKKSSVKKVVKKRESVEKKDEEAAK